MNEKTSIQPGRYRHYKGNEYTVIGTARHSETLEEHVVYRQEYGEHGLWVRPKQMFSETIKVDGQEAPRFQPLASSSEYVGKSVKNIFDDLPQNLLKEVVQTLRSGLLWWLISLLIGPLATLLIVVLPRNPFDLRL